MEVSRINKYQVIQSDLFIPYSWRSLNHLKGSRFRHPKMGTSRNASNMIFTNLCMSFLPFFFLKCFPPLSPFWSVYSPVTWGNSLNKKVKEKNAGNATRWASLPLNYSRHNSIWAMRKRAPGCLGCIGDDILPKYMGIWISLHKDPYKPTRIQWKVVRIFSVAHL